MVPFLEKWVYASMILMSCLKIITVAFPLIGNGSWCLLTFTIKWLM